MDYKCVGKTGSGAGWARAGVRAGRLTGDGARSRSRFPRPLKDRARCGGRGGYTGYSAQISDILDFTDTMESLFPAPTLFTPDPGQLSADRLHAMSGRR